MANWNGKSSHVDTMSYKYDTEDLVVTFKRGGVYKYSGVPEEIWDEMLNAESVGKALNEHIKGVYASEKIS